MTHIDHSLAKRELLAAMALQGLLANPDRDAPIHSFCEEAVMFADALILELAREGETA